MRQRHRGNEKDGLAGRDTYEVLAWRADCEGAVYRLRDRLAARHDQQGDKGHCASQETDCGTAGREEGEGVNELALFAGAGGGILGGKLLGWRTRCAVELDAYCRSVLLARQRDGMLDPFPIWDDVCG